MKLPVLGLDNVDCSTGLNAPPNQVSGGILGACFDPIVRAEREFRKALERNAPRVVFPDTRYWQ